MKVKVQLEDHYYILSRFLVSRILNVIKIPVSNSIRIALDLKKSLVDANRLTVTQSELESQLFSIMAANAYKDEYVRRFRMMTKLTSHRTAHCADFITIACRW